MWQSERTVPLIESLINSPNVGEVIIINNNYLSTPYLPQSDKIKHIQLPVNIMVNAAWNIGVLLSRFENIAICNDDVTFNPSFLATYDDGTLQHLGIIGMAWENYQLKADNNVHLKLMKQRPYGWGCLMLTHVSKYEPIPVQLRIANGDDWLAQHATPYELHGVAIQSEISTTSSLPELGLIQLEDNKVFNEKYRK